MLYILHMSSHPLLTRVYIVGIACLRPCGSKKKATCPGEVFKILGQDLSLPNINNNNLFVYVCLLDRFVFTLRVRISPESSVFLLYQVCISSSINVHFITKMKYKFNKKRFSRSTQLAFRCKKKNERVCMNERMNEWLKAKCALGSGHLHWLVPRLGWFPPNCYMAHFLNTLFSSQLKCHLISVTFSGHPM